MSGLHPRPGRPGDPAHVPDDERSPFGGGLAGICRGKHRLPVCPEVCKGTGPGGGDREDEGSQRPPGADHQTSRRAPDAHDHESLCGRPAGADLPDGLLCGPGQGGHGPSRERILRKHDRSPDPHRESLFDGHRLPPDRVGDPGPRRLRVLRRIPCGAALPRRENHLDL